MCSITFLSSCHLETGKCNSIELYKIIDLINPEIIFEELDLDGFNDHYGPNGPYSTETVAIYHYIQNKNIKHFPVDTYDMKYFTKEDKKYMDNIILNNSNEFRQLLEKQLKLLHLYGYKFINSDECIELITNLQDIEYNVQLKLNDEKLTNIYKEWININNKREEVIIKNIYDYCKNNKFDKGLLIIGAEHRKSLKNKIDNYEAIIKWDYWK